MARVLRSFWFWGLVAVVLLAVGVLAAAAVVMSGPDIDDGSWLVVDLRGGVPEFPPPVDVLAQLTGGAGGESLQRILSNLEKASADDRVEGVILKLGMGFSAGAATRDEIRDAMVPTGTLVFIGSSVIRDYYKGTLDKLGITPNLHRIKDYKSAAEMLTRTDMSPEARENQEWLMDDLWTTMVDHLRADRGLGDARILELMEQALFTGTSWRTRSRATTTTG